LDVARDGRVGGGIMVNFAPWFQIWASFCQSSS
jgi:hypothetical protein